MFTSLTTGHQKPKLTFGSQKSAIGCERVSVYVDHDGDNVGGFPQVCPEMCVLYLLCMIKVSFPPTSFVREKMP